MLTGAKSDKAETFRTRVVDGTGVPGTFGEPSPWSRISSSASNASAKERICLEELCLNSASQFKINSRIVHIVCSKQIFRGELRCSSRIRHGAVIALPLVLVAA